MPQKGEKTSSFLSAVRSAQIAVGLIAIGTIFYGGYYCSYLPYPASDGLAARMAYALRCSVPPVMTLFVAINGVMLGRVSQTVLNPLAGKEHLVQVQKNILTNTLEQFTVYFITSMVLACYLQGPEMRLVALYAMAFTVGRILFNIGYRIAPEYRTLGMSMTSVPIMTVLFYIVYLMATRGFMYGIETATTTPTSEAPGPGGREEL